MPSCQKDLRQVAAAPAEDPQIAGMRIALEPFLHQERQGAEPLAHLWTPLALQELS